MILIGSQALLLNLEQTPQNIERKNKADYDVIMSEQEFTEWYSKYATLIKTLYPTHDNKYKVIVEKDGVRKQYEIELAFGGSQKFLIDNFLHVCNSFVQGFLGEGMAVLSMRYQMLTKRSHLIYPVHFEKNITDYFMLKRLAGCSANFLMMSSTKMTEYYNLRAAEAKERYKQRTPNLNVTNEDFFSSKLNVERFFIHDDIHIVMAHYGKPVYEMMKRDQSKAWCEEDMFATLPYEYRVRCVQEEAYVIALERYIVPKYGKDWQDHFSAYKKAVKRICTTLCSGFFRDFAIESYDKVLEWYDPTFVERFIQAHKDGKIQTVDNKVWRYEDVVDSSESSFAI